MNYNYLKAFYIVAKHQNISNAAEELNVTQPALSRIIATLEKEVNVKLFQRTKFGVTLTSEGLKLYEMIKSPYDELGKIESNLKSIVKLDEEVVNIGATAISLSVFLFSQLETLKKKFPKVKFKIYTDSSSNLIKRLDNKEIDFAFVTTPVNFKDDKEIYYVYELNNVLIAPSSYKNKIKSPTSIKKLAKYPFVLLNGSMQFREHLNDYFRKNSVQINPVYELDSSSNLLQFVKNDCGLTFIPIEMAMDAVWEDKCFIIDLEEKLPTRYVTFVSKKKAIHSNIQHLIKEQVVTMSLKLQNKNSAEPEDF